MTIPRTANLGIQQEETPKKTEGRVKVEGGERGAEAHVENAQASEGTAAPDLALSRGLRATQTTIGELS